MYIEIPNPRPLSNNVDLETVWYKEKEMNKQHKIITICFLLRTNIKSLQIKKHILIKYMQNKLFHVSLPLVVLF